MTYKNILTLLSILASVAFSASAMKEQKPNNSILKTVLVTLKESPVEEIKLKVQIKVATPESAITDEQKQAYYTSHKAAVLGKLQQVLVA